jgi:HSP20 family protein
MAQRLENDGMYRQHTIGRFAMTNVLYTSGERGNAKAGEVFTPAVDIVEGDESYTLRLDLPGFEKDDLRVVFKEGVLTVSGERNSREPETGEFYRYFERPSGTFRRDFRIAEDVVDGGKVEAEYRNGVLTLALRKKEKAKPRMIAVN